MTPPLPQSETAPKTLMRTFIEWCAEHPECEVRHFSGGLALFRGAVCLLTIYIESSYRWHCTSTSLEEDDTDHEFVASGPLVSVLNRLLPGGEGA